MRICVICEGSYPFVAGGVSSWLQGLMRALPGHEFAIWAIGAQKKQRGRFAYELPKNVAFVKEVYLDEMRFERVRPGKFPKLLPAEEEAVRELLTCRSPDWAEVFQLFSDRERNLRFLHSEEFLRIVEDICDPRAGFGDFFWTVRSMFLPLLYLIGDDVPEADLYYAISTGYAGVFGSMASLRTGKPFVLTEHGIYTREREEEILRTSWVPPNDKDLWIAMFYMFTRCAYHHAARVTALFHRASLIQQEIGCPKEKCAVIPNGVHFERFAAIPPKRDDGYVDIGAVVRLVPIKDIKTMLYAFAIVWGEMPNVRLHIMGPTDEDAQYFEECEQLKIELGLESVRFTGRVDVRAYLEAIDFTLLTSISEGQPLAVLESMAAGRPCVATDVGSCRELLLGADDEFGPAGLCVPAMHQSALAEAMLTLCSDAKLRRRMGEAGRLRVFQHYRHDSMVRRYGEIFEEVRRSHYGGNRV